MSCELLRERFSQDPTRAAEEFDRHAEGCSACQAYRSRLLRAESLIQKALRFDVTATANRSADDVQTGADRSSWIMLATGIAAGVLIAVMFWSTQGTDLELNAEQLAAAVADHWYNEPESWNRSDSQVAGTLLETVLDGAAEINLAQLRTVSYAESCLVAGEWIPHLVVQGEQGPYMVLLMPGRVLESAIPLQLPSEGLSGHIVPAGAGSIAVLGGGLPAELEQVEATLVSAVDWTI
jgi:hypothetical protein